MTTTTTDPIADMLARIRNAIAVGKRELELPHSSIKEAVAKLLKDNNFIESVKVEDGAVSKTLSLTINDEGSNARITEIKRLSRPGRRQYTGHVNIPAVMHGRGIVIVSTSKGLMTGDEAKKAGIGGELIASVY